MRKYVLIALAATLLTPTFTFAESLTFRIRSYHPKQVNIAFYSQNRNHSWPGGGQVYVLDDYEVHDYSLGCIQGEKVCYGAWVRGSNATYWGSGQGGKEGCQSCCFVCNGGTTPVRNLNAR